MPRPQRLHEHSLATYREERPVLGARASAILDLFQRVGPMSDRDAMKRLGYTDMNAVRPRITELVDVGLLEEVDEVRDPMTRRWVRICAVATNERKEQLALSL